MTTISFSVEDAIKKDISKLAKKRKQSQSDVFRDMFAAYKFASNMEPVYKATDRALKALNIKTDEELFDYLESDDTYEDRIRHQHLPSSN